MNRFISISGLIILVLFASLSLAGIPKMINYQGMLTDNSGTPLSGSYNLIFKVWTDTTGGSSLWTETQNGVQVQNGLFNVILGRVTALNLSFDQQYWLEVVVGSEIMPRLRMTSVGYAYRAQRSDTAYYAVIASAPCTLQASLAYPGSVLYVKNTGTGDGVEIGGVGNDGVRVRRAGDDGIQVDSAENGFVLYRAADDGVWIARAGSRGIYIDSAGLYGIEIGYVGNDHGAGIRIDSSKWIGISVVKAQFGMTIDALQDGITVSAGYGGIIVGSEGWHGVMVYNAGSDGVHIDKAESDGVEIDTVEATGVYIQHARGWHGVHVERAAVDGFVISQAGNNGLTVVNAGWDGVLVQNAGLAGIYAAGDVAGGKLVAGKAGGRGLMAYSYSSVATDTAIQAWGKGLATGGWATGGLKGNREAPCLISPELGIVAAGTGKLVNSQAEISFDPIFTENIRDDIPVKVTVTPRGKPAGFLYLAETKTTGFKVELEAVPGLEKNSSDLAFDWIAFATLKEYETSPEAKEEWNKILREREKVTAAHEKEMKEREEKERENKSKTEWKSAKMRMEKDTVPGKSK